MSFKYIPESQQQISKWSGGSTSQIYIYPEESSYVERTFDIRISSATVELDESDFTPLAGYNRQIMILEGVMDLIHQNGQSEQIHIHHTPFMVSSFDGKWSTKSIGKVKDFNLMTRYGIQGQMGVLDEIHQIEILEELEKYEMILFFVAEGQANVEASSTKENLSLSLLPMESFLIINDEDTINHLTLEVKDKSKLIYVTIEKRSVR